MKIEEEDFVFLVAVILFAVALIVFALSVYEAELHLIRS